jgi:hypothetical protein
LHSSNFHGKILNPTFISIIEAKRETILAIGRECSGLVLDSSNYVQSIRRRSTEREEGESQSDLVEERAVGDHLPEAEHSGGADVPEQRAVRPHGIGAIGSGSEHSSTSLPIPPLRRTGFFLAVRIDGRELNYIVLIV